MANFQDIYKRRNVDPRFENILNLLKGGRPDARQHGTPGFAGGTLQGQVDRDQQIPTYGRPRHGTMEVRTGELEGIAPPPLNVQSNQGQENSNPWTKKMPDGRTVTEAVMETLRGGQSQQARYRGSDRPEDGDPGVMALPSSGEVVVGQGGRIEGFGDQRDYEPLAGVNREAILETLKRGSAVPLGGNQTRTAQDTAVPLGGNQPRVVPNTAVPLGGKGFESGFPAPDEQEFAVGQEQRPWKAGYGVGETDPLKREAARIRAMIENPKSNVSASGSVDVPHPMSKKKAALLGLLYGLAQASQGKQNPSLAEVLSGGATGAGIGLIKPGAIQEWRRRMEVEDAQGQLARQQKLGLEQARIENEQASTYDKLNKPPAGSTRIVDEGEYPDVPGGTEIRQRWNGREMEDVVGRNGKPIVANAAKERPSEIKYNRRGEAVLVPKDGGPAKPILNEDGTPLTKEANESGNVQTAYRLEPDGITQIQVERNENGEWVDSVGPGGRRIVRANVGRIDPETGAPMASIVTAGRLTEQERRENQRKMQAYTQEEQEWAGKEINFRQNKTKEDNAIKTKTAQLQALYQEDESYGPGGMFGGKRTKQEIETDKARLVKELEIHRENAKRFQGDADKAAASATEARRNRSLYSDSGPQGTSSPRAAQRSAKAPARDGKYHYTRAEVEAAAKAQGKDPNAAYRALKARKDVVISE